MSSSFFFGITITWLALILAIESVYNPFLYEDGHSGEEHCCLVRVRENFCLATPITRSLIQVNKQCARFQTAKNRRSDRKNRNDAYLERITRRLNVQKVHEDEEKIFIELQKPLDKNILQNNLICLTSTNQNNINFEKCYVELADDLHEDHIPQRKNKRRNPRGHDENINQIERPLPESDDHEATEDNEAEMETYRVALSQPIRIREGRGLSLIKQYHIKPNQIRPKTYQQRRCWSWYRDRTRKLRRNPSKSSKSCVQLNAPREQCITQLIHNTLNDIEPMKLTYPIGSKLFCKNGGDHNKLLGYYDDGEICFNRDDQVQIEYKFTDIARLSDRDKNKGTLEFLASDAKLTAEFEDDCHGKRNLVEDPESEIATSNMYSKKN